MSSKRIIKTHDMVIFLFSKEPFNSPERFVDTFRSHFYGTLFLVQDYERDFLKQINKLKLDTLIYILVHVGGISKKKDDKVEYESVGFIDILNERNPNANPILVSRIPDEAISSVFGDKTVFYYRDVLNLQLGFEGHPPQSVKEVLYDGDVENINFFSLDINNNSQHQLLKKLLRNLASLVEYHNLKVKGEPKLNSFIIDFFKRIFEDSQTANSGIFISQSEIHSLPDMIIESLHTAIEVKLLREKEDIKKLERLVDQVKTDVDYYANNSIYIVFYAVFYCEIEITWEQFNLIWKSKSFPEYWIPILVCGKNITE